MNPETEERFVAAETKLSYIEDFVSQLQEVVVAQARTIDTLQNEVKILAGRFAELQESLTEIPSRKPPHY